HRAAAPARACRTRGGCGGRGGRSGSFLLSVYALRGTAAVRDSRAARIAGVYGDNASAHATEEPGYWTFRSRPNPPLQAPLALVRLQLLGRDHAGVEEAGLVQ